MPNLKTIVAFASLSLGIPGLALAGTSQTAQPGAAATTPAATTNVQLAADGKVTLAAGTEVYDTQGGKVGTLTKVENDAAGQPANVILKTANSEVLIPASSLARTEKHALIAMTAAQIDAAAAAAANTGQAQAPQTSAQ